MRKEVICKNCKKRITVSSWANDRVELGHEKGETFDLECGNCKEVCKYSVNEVSASTNSLLNSVLFIITLAIMAIVGYYLFSNFWGKSFYMIFALPIAIAIPGMIFFTYAKSQNDRIRNFNRFRK